MTSFGSGPDRRKLFDFADARRGVFLTAEAKEAGFSPTALAYGVDRADYRRIGHGIYRLVDYPTSPDDRIVEVAALLGPTAVISHESALERYEVCDVAPSRIHVTLPRSQRFRARDMGDTEIHTTDDGRADTGVQRHGYRISTLERAIVDSARTGTDPKQIDMAVRTARRKGLLSEAALAEQLADASQRVRDEIPAADPEPAALASATATTKTYASSRAFESALVTKLNERKTRIRSIDDMRKEIAFDRVLARLQNAAPDVWLLKGGVALDYRLDHSRSTRDVDLTARVGIDEMTQALQDASRAKIDDYFQMTVGDREKPIGEVDTYRFSVSINYADGRPFMPNLKIDVGFADPWIGEPEKLTAPALLDFAGIPPVRVSAIPIEQHLAEKIHAYTRTYARGESSRVKDIVDMALMVDHRTFDPKKLHDVIATVFESRATHAIPERIPAPPISWNLPYETFARDLPIPKDLAGAYRHVANALDPVLDRDQSPSHEKNFER